MKANDGSQRDTLENSYFYFVKTLSILAEAPAQQCDAMGYYNVAWELRDEGLDVDWLIQQEVIKFTAGQIGGMKDLSTALHALDTEASKGGETRDEHLKAMSNPGWQTVRDIARKLLVSLAPSTLENRKYLKLP